MSEPTTTNCLSPITNCSRRRLGLIELLEVKTSEQKVGRRSTEFCTSNGLRSIELASLEEAGIEPGHGLVDRAGMQV